MKNFNLFCSTLSLTNSREDHLTEFFAACLLVSPCFSRRFTDWAISPYAEKKGWQAHPKIQSVETQVSYDSGGTPDMRLTLEDGHILLIENKLESPETKGTKGDPEKKQLSRYLDIPKVAGVLYIRASLSPPSDEVLNHPKYVSPESGDHFLWRDIYCLFKGIEHDVVRWTRQGFEQLGFTPPAPEIGDLNDPDEQERERIRSNFAKFWLKTRTKAHNHGWKTSSGSIVELYLEHNNPQIPGVWVAPVQSTRILIRVNSSDSVPIEKVKRILKGVKGVDVPFEIEKNIVSRTKGKASVVEIVARLRDIIPAAGSATDIEIALHDFVTPFILAIGESLNG